jgi:hypothetical protein
MYSKTADSIPKVCKIRAVGQYQFCVGMMDGKLLDDSEIGVVRSGFNNAVIARQLREPQQSMSSTSHGKVKSTHKLTLRKLWLYVMLLFSVACIDRLSRTPDLANIGVGVTRADSVRTKIALTKRRADADILGRRRRRVKFTECFAYGGWSSD